MISISNIVFLLIVTNLIAGIVLLYQHRNTLSSKPNSSFKFLEITNHKFEDPIIAYYVLNKLDIFEPVDYTYLDDLASPTNTTASYGHYYYSFSSDEHYCEKHRAYFIDHPEYVFYERNVILDYLNTSLVRRLVIPSIGVDLVPNISAAIPEKIKKTKSFDIPPNVNSFFVNGPMHVFREIGRNFACVTQTYNHIPGHSTLNRKDFVAESAVTYAKKYEKRSHCFNFDKFFPQTWTLYLKDQCEAFFKHFNSPDYAKLKAERRIVYIRKIGSGAHKAKGVEPVDAIEEKNLRDLYENGALCGRQDKNYIVQHFVHNPLLLEGHKFDFRIYMMVASTNPMILYYHDGFLRLSLHKYDVNSDDKSVLLTNTDLSLNTIKEASHGTLFNGMNETELRNFQMWNFTRLHNHLYDNGYVRDRNWLDNYLRPEFKKAMIHLLRMSQHSFLQRSSIYEFFGVDFMLDDDLNLWFLECNTSPVLKGTSDEKEKFLKKMLQDHFEIVIGLLQSRTKRIIALVNEITREIQREELAFEDFYIKELYQRRKEFKEITKNRFEPEFLPSADNGFSKIIDENYEGMERYSNLISKDCL